MHFSHFKHELQVMRPPGTSSSEQLALNSGVLNDSGEYSVNNGSFIIVRGCTLMSAKRRGA